MIKAIIFDFDGVIVESVDIKTKAFAELFEQERSEVVKKVIDYHLNNTGVSRYDKFRYIYKEILKRPLRDEEFQILCDKFADLVVSRVIDAPYVKGAIEFLKDYVPKKYKCFLVSATPQKEIKEILQKRHIAHFFSVIYGASTKKSHAVREILNEENIMPIDTVYVGDAMSDYLAAKDNVVNFIARINNNESIFNDIDCIKVKDLQNLNMVIENF